MVSMLCGCHHHRQHQQHFGSDNLLCSKHHEECGKCAAGGGGGGLCLEFAACSLLWCLSGDDSTATATTTTVNLIIFFFTGLDNLLHSLCDKIGDAFLARRLGLGWSWRIITIVFSFSLFFLTLALPHSIAGRCCALTHVRAPSNTPFSNFKHTSSPIQLSSAHPQVHSRVTRQVFTLVFTVSLNHVRSL